MCMRGPAHALAGVCGCGSADVAHGGCTWAVWAPPPREDVSACACSRAPAQPFVAALRKDAAEDRLWGDAVKLRATFEMTLKAGVAVEKVAHLLARAEEIEQQEAGALERGGATSGSMGRAARSPELARLCASSSEPHMHRTQDATMAAVHEARARMARNHQNPPRRNHAHALQRMTKPCSRAPANDDAHAHAHARMRMCKRRDLSPHPPPLWRVCRILAASLMLPARAHRAWPSWRAPSRHSSLLGDQTRAPASPLPALRLTTARPSRSRHPPCRPR